MNPEPLYNLDDHVGVLICGHGSRNRLAVEEFAQLALSIKSRLKDIPVEYGYLEFARPTISEALDILVEKSINRVIAIPAMLFAAGHAKNDIPSLLNNYSKETGIKIDYGRELGINNLMIGAAGERIREAMNSTDFVPPSETLLVVVGRGSSDPDANSNVSKITRMLVEGFGFGWGETLYSGVTFPLVEPGLRHVIRLGFKRIIVFPYFLFSGVLVSRIRKYTLNVANEFTNIEFIMASYLGDHSFVVDNFKERIDEVLLGRNFMNCALCKYRSEVIGFENEVGLAQEGHHHHVEGLSNSCNLCESECTGDCEEDGRLLPVSDSADYHDRHANHTHSHYPYPQADHPLGPGSLKKNSKDKS